MTIPCDLQEGMIALWRGWLPSVIGVIPYVGLNFSVYETLKDMTLKAYGEQMLYISLLFCDLVAVQESGKTTCLNISMQICSYGLCVCICLQHCWHTLQIAYAVRLGARVAGCCMQCVTPKLSVYAKEVGRQQHICVGVCRTG